ncbi:hypothetical protein A9P82_08530 [Arachidicoccus ginsenosidimutans]|uniref:hypothetical protein n=1 Tax=Arachidicoccus sp. BS20 TaxID=1850526 RepID=UPI0007F13292|nr:hypothetical protein [Arachidicoccus sp. BS20]ANI89333.1 hypothetical protein A9P82_08530 [Arachidicoccus sp. BS20]
MLPIKHHQTAYFIFSPLLLAQRTNNTKSYDYNGNITKMYQYGLKSSGSSSIIDQLTYTYSSYSNKLAKVADAAPVDSAEHLGDF